MNTITLAGSKSLNITTASGKELNVYSLFRGHANFVGGNPNHLHMHDDGNLEAYYYVTKDNEAVKLAKTYIEDSGDLSSYDIDKLIIDGIGYAPDGLDWKFTGGTEPVDIGLLIDNAQTILACVNLTSLVSYDEEWAVRLIEEFSTKN